MKEKKIVVSFLSPIYATKQTKLLRNPEIPKLPPLLNKIPAKLDGATDIQSHK